MRNKERFYKLLAIAALVVALALPQAQAQEKEEPNQILITNVNVWDGNASALQNDMNVLIKANKVESISKNRPGATGATVIDDGGRTLMPGLIDMHTHLMFPQGLPDHENKWGAAASGAMAREGFG